VISEEQLQLFFNMISQDSIINVSHPILVTGAAGFIGARVVHKLADAGFRRIRCLVRPSSDTARLRHSLNGHSSVVAEEMISGNLLSREDCLKATRDVAVIYHLAAGTGTKSFPDAYMNSVVTTRNLLESALQQNSLKRFVSLSSFAVYSNVSKPRPAVLDESAPIEPNPESRAEAYCYAKVKQDELILQYGRERKLPYVLLRPGLVYGPGKSAIPGRVGTDSFGVFLHFGGTNRIPFTYVDNCADAIVLAGLKKGVDGEIFNIVDDDLPSSRQFLRLYKKNVKKLRSIYIPHFVSYLFCWLWEGYCRHSNDQLPPIFTRKEWTAYWKKTDYTNAKVKQVLGWSPTVSTSEGLNRFFEGCRARRELA
jgi:nucleoside-diphosphate-sugar epimerase